MLRVGPGRAEAFVQTGDAFLRCFIELCQLQPQEDVLDVGCGIGRMALPLTEYLEPSARYEGFDVERGGVDWCRENITPMHPNFRFQHIDLFNRNYNPTGEIVPSTFRFPYGDEEFDFAFLTSIFTHMLPEDVERYLCEVGRVLRPGGRCLITYFLLNTESLEQLSAGAVPPEFNFAHDFDVFRSTKREVPEAALAYDENFVVRLYEQAGLDAPAIHYGSWCGRKEFVEGQDVVVAYKPR
jgi:SAM-dependent methyltransferase